MAEFLADCYLNRLMQEIPDDYELGKLFYRLNSITCCEVTAYHSCNLVYCEQCVISQCQGLRPIRYTTHEIIPFWVQAGGPFCQKCKINLGQLKSGDRCVRCIQTVWSEYITPPLYTPDWRNQFEDPMDVNHQNRINHERELEQGRPQDQNFQSQPPNHVYHEQPSTSNANFRELNNVYPEQPRASSTNFPPQQSDEAYLIRVGKTDTQVPRNFFTLTAVNDLRGTNDRQRIQNNLNQEPRSAMRNPPIPYGYSAPVPGPDSSDEDSHSPDLYCHETLDSSSDSSVIAASGITLELNSERSASAYSPRAQTPGPNQPSSPEGPESPSSESEESYADSSPGSPALPMEESRMEI